MATPAQLLTPMTPPQRQLVSRHMMSPEGAATMGRSASIPDYGLVAQAMERGDGTGATVGSFASAFVRGAGAGTVTRGGLGGLFSLVSGRENTNTWGGAGMTALFSGLAAGVKNLLSRNTESGLDDMKTGAVAGAAAQVLNGDMGWLGGIVTFIAALALPSLGAGLSDVIKRVTLGSPAPVAGSPPSGPALGY